MFFFSFSGGMISMHLGFGGGDPFGGMGGGSSDCGSEFDDYVQKFVNEPFPFSPMGPSSRTLEEFWKDRRLRVYKDSQRYRYGKVVSWQQWNTGPFSRRTNWDITVEYDNDIIDDEVNCEGGAGGSCLEKGDVVVIGELPKKHKGKKGTIVNCDLANNKCKIKLISERDDLQFVNVKKEHLKSMYTFRVHRMNVTGGGTLVAPPRESSNTNGSTGGRNNNNATNDNNEEQEKNLSLEWVDPARPSSSLLYQGSSTISANCPTCRAVEPTFRAFDDDTVIVATPTSRASAASAAAAAGTTATGGGTTATSKTEGTSTVTTNGTNSAVALHTCPVCTETKLCRILQCNHPVCMDCWSQWRFKSTTKIPSSVTPPDMNEDKLQKERDRNFQKLRSLLPHTLGGTATKGEGRRRASEDDIKKAYDNFADRRDSIVRELQKNAEDDDNEELGLKRFWKKLMTMSIHLFRLGGVDRLVRDLDSIPALEIVIEVTKSRQSEIDASRLGDGTDDVDDDVKGCVDYLIHRACNRIGEILEGHYEDHRSATHWYERSILHAKKTLLHDNSEDNKGELAMKYNNLALAQKRSGQLSKALENYDTAIQNFPTNIEEQNREVVEGNKGSLMREISHWTGTSGKLTPGC